MAAPARKTIYGETIAQLKNRLRSAMGWPDRKDWRQDEWAELRACYEIRLDPKRGLMVARPLPPAQP